MKTAILLIAIILLALLAPAQALEPAGTRAQNMGGAGAALPTDPGSLYWNPAGLFFQNGLSMDLTLQSTIWDWPNTWGLTYSNFSPRVGQGGGMGLYRIMEKTEPEGGNAFATVLTTVYKTPIGLPVGLSFKYITENWADVGRKNYVTGDVGTFFPLSGFLLGAGFQSVTQPASRLFPYRVNVGLSWNFEHKFTLAGQISGRKWDEFKHPETAKWGAGMEIAPSRAISFQGGYSESPLERYWTGGFGLGTRQGGHVYFGYHWHPEKGVDDRLFLTYSARM